MDNWSFLPDFLLWWLFAASVSMFLLSPLAVSWLVVRLPADYFAPRRRHRVPYWQRHPLWGPVFRVAKNSAGVVLALAGLVMLFVPGQGLLTLAAGLMLIDFPGKYRLERWLVTRHSVWRSINWLRRRAGREPLVPPA